LSSPYPFDSSDPDAFRFKTDNEIEYLIYFYPSPDFSNDYYPEFANNLKAFGFSIETSQRKSLPFDDKVRATIVFILKLFFEQNPFGILTYSIDNQDGRDLQRNRIFDRWYDREIDSGIQKIGGRFGTRNAIYYYLLFRNDHPYRNLILDCSQYFSLFYKTKP
jgi:hypothetical protein